MACETPAPMCEFDLYTAKVFLFVSFSELEVDAQDTSLGSKIIRERERESTPVPRRQPPPKASTRTQTFPL